MSHYCTICDETFTITWPDEDDGLCHNCAHNLAHEAVEAKRRAAVALFLADTLAQENARLRAMLSPEYVYGVEADRLCPKCHGVGRRIYPNTATWNSGVGVVSGQGFTPGICDECWGSGDAGRRFPNLRDLKTRLFREIDALTKAALDVILPKRKLLKANGGSRPDFSYEQMAEYQTKYNAPDAAELTLAIRRLENVVGAHAILRAEKEAPK